MRSKMSKRLHGLDAQAGFFQDLAPHRVLQQFARLDQSARQRPVSFQRIAAALHQQNRTAPRRIG